MKRIFVLLIIGANLLASSLPTVAASEDQTIEMMVDEEPEVGERPSKGIRMPSHSKECTIDFGNHRIELSTSEFILSYELRDEDGTLTLASYASDAEFVEFLSGVSGTYQLRLIGEEHVYIGYLEL